MPGTRTFRGLLLVAVVVPFVLLVFYTPEDLLVADPPHERDLRSVYCQLSDRSNFELFHRWCPLRVQNATPDETTLLQKELEAAPASRMVFTTPMTENLRPGNHFKSGIEWLRINHAKDSKQWLGVGSVRFGYTGNRWVVVRVPVGFEVGD